MKTANSIEPQSKNSGTNLGTETAEVLNMVSSGAATNADSKKTTNEEQTRAKRRFLETCAEAEISSKEFWLLDEMADMPTKYSRNHGYLTWSFTVEQLAWLLTHKHKAEAGGKEHEKVSIQTVQALMDKLFEGRDMDADRVISHIHVQRIGLDEVDKAGHRVRLPVYTCWSDAQDRSRVRAEYKSVTLDERDVEEAKQVQQQKPTVPLDERFEKMNTTARVFLWRDEFWRNHSRQLQEEYGVTSEECSLLESIMFLDWNIPYTFSDLAAHVNQSMANKVHPSGWSKLKFITGDDVRAVLSRLQRKQRYDDVEFGNSLFDCFDGVWRDGHGKTTTLEFCTIRPFGSDALLQMLFSFEPEIVSGNLVKTASGDWVMMNSGEVVLQKQPQAQPELPL